MTLRWEHPPHRPDIDIVDTDLGRYLIRRATKRSRTWVVLFNGARTSYSGTREQCHRTVDRILANAAVAKTRGNKYGDPNWTGPAAKSIAQPDTRLLINYIGVVTLLGRIAKHLPKGDEDRYGLDKAMRDANNWLLVNGNDIVYMKASGGGYAAFSREQLNKEKVP